MLITLTSHFFTWSVIEKQDNTVNFNSVFRCSGVLLFLVLVHAYQGMSRVEMQTVMFTQKWPSKDW